MSERKLILPTEVRVCATCTYWDGKRTVDEEMHVVIVCESCQGECLVSESLMGALAKGEPDCDCLWDDLHGDDIHADEIAVDAAAPEAPAAPAPDQAGEASEAS